MTQIIGGSGRDFINGSNGNDTIQAKDGNDDVYGGDGVDTIIFDYASTDVTAFYHYPILGPESKPPYDLFAQIQGPKGTDSIRFVELFKFTDRTLKSEDLEATFGHLNGDFINDVFELGNFFSSIVNGFDGYDTVALYFLEWQLHAFSVDDQTINIVSEGKNYELTNIEAIEFSGKSYTVDEFKSTFSDLALPPNTILGHSYDDTLLGTEGDDFLYSGSGVDLVDGKGGIDTIQFFFAADEVEEYTRIGDEVKFSRSAVKFPYDANTIKNVEFFKFSDITVHYDDLDQVLSTSTRFSAKFGEKVSGGAGIDVVSVEFDELDINKIVRKLDNTVEIRTDQGDIFLESIESIAFLGKSPLSLNALISEKNVGKPVFNAVFNKESITVTPETYSGVVDFLEYQLLGNSTGNVVVGSIFNDFLNLLGGDDAANGGGGNDVLDGGTGSNFLTGGQGGDTFFLDGRGGAVTWSTVTDFEGDSVNIWGWQEGISQLLFTRENEGAEGFKGATFHFDLNNDGAIDTSITFSGLSVSEVPKQSAEVVDGNGYLLFA